MSVASLRCTVVHNQIQLQKETIQSRRSFLSGSNAPSWINDLLGQGEILKCYQCIRPHTSHPTPTNAFRQSNCEWLLSWHHTGANSIENQSIARTQHFFFFTFFFFFEWGVGRCHCLSIFRNHLLEHAPLLNKEREKKMPLATASCDFVGDVMRHLLMSSLSFLV